MKLTDRKSIDLENNTYIVILFLVFIITYLQEFIFRGNIENTSLWILSYGGLFLANYVINILLYLIIFMISGSSKVAFYVHAPLLILLSSINHYKLTYKGDVLLFSDYKLLWEAVNVVKNYKLEFYLPIIIAIGILGVLFFPISRTNTKSLEVRRRVIGSIMSGVGLVVTIVILRGNISWLEGEQSGYIIADRYRSRGVLVGMIKEIPDTIQQPSEYSEEKIFSILENINIEDDQQAKKVFPNIIMVMNETYYDIDKLEELEFNQEIMPNLRKYQEEFTRGQLITPSYGGLTCQVEYEVLTGYPSSNCEGRIGYLELINKPTKSIVSALKDNGYVTYAIHPYTKQFFNRSRVYEALQFDDMTFIEDMVDLEYEGQYVSDRYVYKQLIDKYKTRDRKKPFFAHVVTMQNHGGYNYRYDKYGVKEIKKFSKSNNEVLETYVNLLKESDHSLGYLLDYISDIKDPTIVIFYGDHAPNFTMFYKGTFENSKNLEEVLCQYSTPLLIWDNIGLPKKQYGYINAYKLGGEVLRLIGNSKDYYFKCMENSSMMSVNGMFIKEKRGLISNVNDEEYKEYKEEINELYLLQYDRLFGEDYGSNYLNRK